MNQQLLAASEFNPCLSCGACCAYYRVSFYSGELEGETGGTVPVELTVQIAPLRACMKGTEKGNGRCVALKGQLGQPGIHCEIYAQRPSPCKDFYLYNSAGQPNPDCQRLRAKIGLSPLPEQPPPPLTNRLSAQAA